MSHAVATAGLFALAGALFLLPLVPAIAELRLKRDAQALNVIQQYAGDIRHFSFGFRSYAADLLGPLQQCVASGGTVTGTLPHGDLYILLGRADTAPLVRPGANANTCDLLVACGTDLTLSDGMTFAKEIYALRRLTGGSGCSYRAILGDASVDLARGSAVTRWAHAAGILRADHDCDLYGRISSEREIELKSGCLFQRLHAPRIRFGPAVALARGGAARPLSPGSVPLAVAEGRRLVDGDLEIAPGETVQGSVVARGKLWIGAGARILGSVKSNKHMKVEAGVSVAGSLISASTMHIGPDCRIAGPVIAEQEMVLETGVRCGFPSRPTTVSAPAIEVEEGVVVCGTIWARNEGHVTPKP